MALKILIPCIIESRKELLVHYAAAGAVLVEERLGKKKLIVLRKLYDQEDKYSAVEKETLAIRWAINSLLCYLMEREFLPQMTKP